jgi:predicted SAM-dependent methyltransferase
MIRRDCYERVGLYDARFATLPDFQMWMRLLAVVPIHILAEPLIGFRELPNAGNASSISSFNSYVRLAWEHVHVRKCYVDMRPEVFESVFASEMVDLRLPSGGDRRLALGQICISVENPNLNRLGLELLFEALPADPLADDPAGRFSHADFCRATGTKDVYQLLSEFRIIDLARQLREVRQPLVSTEEGVTAPMAWSLPPEDKLKLNLGCGANILPGWLNLDLEPMAGAYFWDAIKIMPFEPETVSIIYSEHFIEHLDIAHVMHLLRECNRILCPGGILRLSTPDLQVLVAAYIGGHLDQWRDVGWVPRTPCDLMNEGMRAWGHRYLFDRERLVDCLHQAGFLLVAPAPWRQSRVVALEGRECRPFCGELIFEAQK